MILWSPLPHWQSWLSNWGCHCPCWNLDLWELQESFQASPWMCQMEMFIFSGSSLCALWGALGSKVLSPRAPSSPRPRAGGLELPCPLWMSLEQWPSRFQGSYHRYTHPDCTPPPIAPTPQHRTLHCEQKPQAGRLDLALKCALFVWPAFFFFFFF